MSYGPLHEWSWWVGLLLGVAGLAALPLLKRARPLSLGVALLGLFYTFLIHPGIIGSSRASNDRNASAALATLREAQRQFREGDVDGNGVKDYWRADIAGLYVVKEAKLIELSVAGADEKPTTPIDKFTVRAPKSGYWFRCLRFADEKELDPARWAACAIPVNREDPTFLVTHEGTLHRRPGPHALERVPSPDEIQRDWTPVR